MNKINKVTEFEINDNIFYFQKDPLGLAKVHEKDKNIVGYTLKLMIEINKKFGPKLFSIETAGQHYYVLCMDYDGNITLEDQLNLRNNSVISSYVMEVGVSFNYKLSKNNLEESELTSEKSYTALYVKLKSINYNIENNIEKKNRLLAEIADNDTKDTKKKRLVSERDEVVQQKKFQKKNSYKNLFGLL